MCLVTDLWILCRFLSAAPESSLLAAIPHAGIWGWVRGSSPQRSAAFSASARCVCSGHTSSIRLGTSLLLFAGWGYLRTWRLHCIGSSAVRQRDDKQADGSWRVPAQEYLCGKHAGPAVTQARFACLICCSWERWICFSALEGECDDSICLLRLGVIFSEAFCSVASLKRENAGYAFSPRRHLQCPALRPSG